MSSSTRERNMGPSSSCCLQAHDGPIRRRKCGYILMTDQSDPAATTAHGRNDGWSARYSTIVSERFASQGVVSKGHQQVLGPPENRLETKTTPPDSPQERKQHPGDQWGKGRGHIPDAWTNHLTGGGIYLPPGPIMSTTQQANGKRFREKEISG
eukprot:7070039-Pyramimonas_sp.AAC.1